MKRFSVLILVFALGWLLFDRMEKLKKEEAPLDITPIEDSQEDAVVTQKTKVSQPSKDASEEEASADAVVPEDSVGPLVDTTSSVRISSEDPAIFRKDISVVGYSDATKVFMYEWGIDLSRSILQPGKISFEVKNDGTFSHNFSIEGVGDFGKILPGATQKFSVELRPGAFVIYSDKEIDSQHSMFENITVSE